MFPTSGFFRSHNCPYYLSGLCERPYCHFRHMKQEDRPKPFKPAQHASKYSRPAEEQPAPPARQSSRSRQSASQSESDGAGGGGGEAGDDYTPTPLSVLRRAKVQSVQEAQKPPPPPPPSAPAAPPEQLSYEPTPLTVAATATASTTARRRPLQLPAPKVGAAVNQPAAAASAASPGEAYDPTEADEVDAVDEGHSKRMRYSSAAEPSYEPTPISGAGVGGSCYDNNDEDSDDDDEYCPTDGSAASTATATVDKQPAQNDNAGGGEIKQVFLDLFGEEPARSSASSAVASVASSAASPAVSLPASSSSLQSGRGSATVRRMTPSEQVSRRAQHLAANPSALLSQGKVRAPSAPAGAAASAASSSASAAMVIAVPASPLPGTVANNIPDVVRQRYLDRLAEECRLAAAAAAAASPDAGSTASRRAQQLELECYERSANRNVYLNAVILAIKRVRASAAEPADQKRKQQQPDNASQLSDKRFYKHLLKYAMTPSQLADNRYPPHLPPLPYPQPANQLERLCVRCGAAFLLHRPDMTTPPGQCCYHYGRAYSRRVPGAGVQQIYSCCGGDLQAKGCSLGERHVHEYNVYCDTEGFRETVLPDKATVSKKQRRAVYALDCEMIYTDAGKELARVTVIDRSLSVVYDRLVHPSAPIVDCNTRFSGLRAEQLTSAQHRLADVQNELLKMFYSTCILIGHSLESDLQVLKLRHSTVVDTSIVFPHRQGLPKKRALRNLASEILNKIIQAGGDAGHDSSEDARTCMELMFIKLTEDLKKCKFSSPS